MLLRSRLWFSLILIFVSSFAIAQKSLSENDLKKKAEKYFNDQKYDDAVPLYSQLLSVYPQNPLYNYRYGVCLLYSGKDKSQAATYLEAAAKLPKPNSEVYYYLGRTYMYAGHFYEAVDKFNQFKKEETASKVKAMNVDLLIANCQNAIELNKDRRNISIIDHREESRNAFYSSYDFSNASGKLLTATDNFLTPKDKEKKNVPVMFMDKENKTVFYASYGKKGENGKDIYKAINLGNGKWSEPLNLGDVINTNEDEDYPYLDKDGKTLYFCSKGHNSMGGYDIFKSVLDLNTGDWSTPVNIGVPINTVEDDFLFVPTLAGDEATYATAIESQTGTIEVRHIRLGDVVADVSVIKGVFASQDQVMRKEARITVLRESSHDIVTSINTNPRTGEYELMLPPGEDYILVVEGGGYIPHAENFSLPKTEAGIPLKQKVVMNRKGEMEEMTMNDFFQPQLANTTAANEKPSETKVSDVSTRDIDTTKIKPITIDGKSVYVALPVVLQKSDNKNATVNEDKVKSSEEPDVTATGNEEKKEVPEDKTKDDVVLNTPKEAIAPGNDLTKDSANNIFEGKTPDQTTVQSGGEDAASKPDVANTQPVVSEKASNTELVKVSFEDANTVKEEASAAKEQASQKQAIADSLSNLSKEQAKQSEQLMSTDKDSAARLTDESKANAVLAENKKSEAFAMTKIAHDKQKEADRAFSQATQLMTQLKVDTGATAYNTSSKSKHSKTTLSSSTKNENQASQKETGEPTADKTSPVETNTVEKKDSSVVQSIPNETPGQVALNKAPNKEAESTSIHPQEKETANAAPLNPHLENANRLQAESEDLSTKSYEKNQAALNASDKKEKEQLQNEAKDLTKQSVAKKDESAKEALLAEKEEKSAVIKNTSNSNLAADKQAPNPQPSNNTGKIASAPVNGRYEKANELKNESVDLSAQADERNQKALTTTDKNEKSTLLNEAKGLKKLSAERKKEADKEFAVAQKEEKKQLKTTDKTAPITENNRSPEQGNAANSNTPATTDQKIVTDSVSQPLAIVTKKDNPTVDENNQGNNKSENNESASVAKEKPAERTADVKTTAEIAKENNVVAEAIPHYESYTEKNQQSIAAKKQSDVIATKILILPNGKEKDSLVEVSNELNRQSIQQWQDGQKELAQAKEVDPTVEEKMGSVGKGTEDARRKTGEGRQRRGDGGGKTGDEKQMADNSKVEAGSSKMDSGNTGVEAGKQIVDNSKPEDTKTDATNTNEKPKDSATEPATLNPQPITASQPAASDPQPAATSLELDTTRAEYPQYKEVQQQITVKQDETVNVFIEGMQVNKKAMTEKEEELKLRDRAEVEKNPKKKEQLLAQADSVKVIGDSLTDLSKEKLSKAQEDTRTVKTLTTQSDELKSKLMVQRTASNAPEGNALASNPGKALEDGSLKTEDNSPKQQTEVAKPEIKNSKPESHELGGQPLASTEKSADKAAQSNSDAPSGSAPVTITPKTEGASLAQGAAIMPADYSPTDVATFSRSTKKETNAIPMDPALPEGLVFKVQIGAFKTPLTADAFGGLQPLNGESSRPGWIRYCLGLFRSFEPANLLKKEVQGMKYKDAFVVAYFNGKRISLIEAYAIIGKATAAEKQTYASASEKEFNQLSKYKMIQSDVDSKADNDSKSFYGTTETVSKDLIEYTVQVGAYKTSKTPSALTSLLPLNAEQTKTGLYRFTTGRFQTYTSADSMKKVAVATGVQDAFICVYKGGIKMGQTAMMEFLKNRNAPPPPEGGNAVAKAPSPAIVKELVGEASPSLGGVEEASDIIFKIQLGAFKESVPTAMVNSFLQLADQGITQEDDSRGFHIYYAGQYKSYDEAITGKGNAVAKGLKDAFIVPFAKGKRITVAEAQKVLQK